MTMTYNLVDEPWLPVAGHGRVSLQQVFQNPEYENLGGSPLQQAALMKLLLAITQAAATSGSEEEHEDLGVAGLAARCIEYLLNHKDCFDLFGSKPFLQMPLVAAAKEQSFGAVNPEVASGNTTVLTRIQFRQSLDNADKAILLVMLMGFALGGKKTDKSVVLSPGYEGKSITGKPGPSVGYIGFLHSFYLGGSLQQTLWLNHLTRSQVEETRMFPKGIGAPPWECMPAGEDDATARELRESLMGRLVPLCRFCLIKDDGLHYTEGIAHRGFQEGVCDPSTAIDYKQKKALWANPGKRPWRELTALLSFLGREGDSGFQSLQLRSAIGRARKHFPRFSVWSGGLRVSSNAGEQYVSGTDDYVSSRIRLESNMLGETWFVQLEREMKALDNLSKMLYATVTGYYHQLQADGKKIASQASSLFWQQCEQEFQNLVDHCAPGEDYRQALEDTRRRFTAITDQIYNQYCPNESARQLDAWAANRPNYFKYLNPEQ